MMPARDVCNAQATTKASRSGESIGQCQPQVGDLSVLPEEAFIFARSHCRRFPVAWVAALVDDVLTREHASHVNGFSSRYSGGVFIDLAPYRGLNIVYRKKYRNHILNSRMLSPRQSVSICL